MRAIIVDDEYIAINRLTSLLKDIEEVEVVATFQKPMVAIQRCPKISPDLVFTDVEMPQMSGFDFIRNVKGLGCNPHFVFVTVYEHYAIKAFKEQAFDYILKPIDLDELKDTVQRLACNNQLNSERLSLYAKQFKLTAREHEIMCLMIDGYSSQDISEKLFISKYTVDTHRKNILNKAETKNTADLIIRLSKGL